MGEEYSYTIGTLIEAVCASLIVRNVSDKLEKYLFVHSVYVFILTLCSFILNVCLQGKYEGVITFVYFFMTVALCLVAYKFSLKESTVVSGIICIAVGSCELFTGFTYVVLKVENVGKVISYDLLLYFSLLILVIILVHLNIFRKIFQFLMEKEIIQTLLFVFVLFAMLYLLFMWKSNLSIDIEDIFFLCFSSMILIIGILEWRRKSFELAEKKKDLQIHDLYSKPFEDLIVEILQIQHEYDNYLCALSSVHLLADTEENSTSVANEFIKKIEESNRPFINILKISNKILAGFLYSKLLNANDQSINLHIEIKTFLIKTNASDSDLVSVMGILIDNALENNVEKQTIYLELDCRDNKVIFEIKNHTEYLEISQIERFFSLGYSTKSKQHQKGFGLYNAKKIVLKNSGKLIVRQEIYQGLNYICFKVII